MKKFFSSFALWLFGVINAFGYDFETAGIYYNILSESNKTCEVTFSESEYGSKYTGEITIPANVSYNGKEYSVVGIGYHAFYRCSKTNFTKITLPNTIEIIGDYAFFEDEGLTEINLPANLKSIGEGAFGWCKNITGSIEIPSNVVTIGGLSFEGCRGITSVKIGNKCDSIGKSAFSGCNLIESMSFPSSLKIIGESAFSGCESLSDVVFEEGLIEIGKSAFNGCKKISKISTPSSLVSIGNYAFADCSNISELAFANGLQSIGEYAFKGCVKLTSVKIPDTVTAIGRMAFTGPSSGNAIQTYELFQIGNGLTDLSEIFYGTKIIRLVIGNGINQIKEGKSVFGNTLHYSHKPQLYLLTNNVVSLVAPTSTSPYNTTGSPDCYTFVADSTKYSSDLVKKFRIKNLIHSTYYQGEYSGEEPNLNIQSNLGDYNIILDQNSKNVGTYSSVNITFTNEDFSSTITVPCSYTITKAPLNIIANDKVAYYGEEIPELDCSYVGLKNAETAEYALSAIPTVVTSAKKGSSAGVYTINVSGAEARNYSLSYTNGTLTIKKALQEITWNQPFNDCFVDDEIELDATSSSGLPITYTSSDQSIAFITTENGKQILHLIKDGIVKISAIQSGNENYEAAQEISKSIKVIARAASNISLSQSSATLKEGESITLYATIKPESVLEKGVAWSSSGNQVATVNNGVVTAVKIGKTVITATTIDGSNLSATCDIEVAPVLVSSVTLSQNNASVLVGESLTLACTIKPDNATYKDVQWESSNTNVAVVENGLVQTKNVGNTVISAITTDGTNLKASCALTVNPILASSISISESTIGLNVGQTVTLSATIKPDNATNKDVAWTSSNPSVAVVTDGIVTALSSGSCVIKAKTIDGSGLEATCSVSIASIPVSGVSFDKESILLLVDDEVTIIASVYPNNATEQALVWSSSNASVASVKDGMIKALGAGDAVITARTIDGSEKTATCNITVNRHPQIINWIQDLSAIQIGGELIELHAESTSGLPIVFSSSNDDVVSIFDMGSVVYLNPIKVGVSVITVTQSGNRYYEEVSVSKDANVIDASGVENIMADNDKYIVTSINGMRVGVFSKEEYHNYIHKGNKGLFIVNGIKILIK